MGDEVADEVALDAFTAPALSLRFFSDDAPTTGLTFDFSELPPADYVAVLARTLLGPRRAMGGPVDPSKMIRVNA